MKEKFQSFGKAMLVPISLIAISGLLLGLGGVFTSEATMSSLGVNWDQYHTGLIYTLFQLLRGLGGIVIGNLSVLYAVGVAFSLARKEKGWAAFSSLIAYFAYLITVQTFLAYKGYNASNTSVTAFIEAGLSPLEAAKTAALYTTELGYFVHRAGVLGGISIGLLVTVFHNRYYNIKLPAALSFFAGTRAVAILVLFLGMFYGVVIVLIWPTIGMLFGHFAEFIAKSGLVGTFIYRSCYEALVPFGMHQIISLPMRWTELGGSMIIDGTLVVGNQAIQLAQLASDASGKLLVRSFMAGMGVINYAIFPGAALAMYKTCRPENRKKVAGLLIPTIVSCVFFGITEPILFTFLFIAPWLYFLVYVPLAGIAEAICEFFQVSVYQGNIKDLIPFLLRPEKLTLWPYLFILPLFFVLSFLLFRQLILWKNVMTPGRSEAQDEDSIKLYSKKDYANRDKAQPLADRIVMALGGSDNIIEVDNCISRLRVLVNDSSIILPDTYWMNELGAAGLIRFDGAVQIIYGAKVTNIALDVKSVLGV